ncbi:hypothetical protein DTO282E5_390 [Paecilomyces variotii]|nr:hypothetical protein DTO282E5_390 [Paecilomyces variotii]
MADASKKQKVVIVGAGPVGSLAALYAASRGDDVEIYELRGDLRDPSTIPLNFTKSINLALSERGINSMKESGRHGLIDKLLQETIPMYGRMIHGRNASGELWGAAQAYDVHGRAINAVDRGSLNNALLDELDRTPNVKMFFNHKLTGADFRSNKAWFEQRLPEGADDKSDRAPEVEVSFDMLIGADGAHSATRYHMMKFARVDYQQEYIDTLWCEFRIPPTEDGNFRISPNHLHIWPGKEFMFIALPSADKSFTCTLFAPSSHYSKLEDGPEKVVEFFDKYFPGVCPDLITPDALQEQFTSNPHLPLISIKCKPHHYGSSVVILGDAAHAVLPFYGQGLNAGMEDVRVLFEILDKHGVYNSLYDPDVQKALRASAFQAYTDQRAPDTHAINDLSKRNYLEMRWGVKLPLYKLRKYVEETLDSYFPRLGWRTQYSRVSFSNERYSEVIRAADRQGEIFTAFLGSVTLSLLGSLGFILCRFRTHILPSGFVLSPLQTLTDISFKVYHATLRAYSYS